MDPARIYDFSFFSVNHTFETVLLLQKQYVTHTDFQDPQGSVRHQQFAEMTALT